MICKGKVTQVLEPIKGTSARGAWQIDQFVILYDDEYNRHLIFKLLNKQDIAEKIKVGQILKVEYNPQSKQNDRGYWNTDNLAWKIELAQ